MQDPSHSDCIIPVRFINKYILSFTGKICVSTWVLLIGLTATNVYVVADLKLFSWIGCWIEWDTRVQVTRSPSTRGGDYVLALETFSRKKRLARRLRNELVISQFYETMLPLKWLSHSRDTEENKVHFTENKFQPFMCNLHCVTNGNFLHIIKDIVLRYCVLVKRWNV